MIAVWLTSLALAQSAPPPPPLQGDAFRPSPFADATWSVDDADADLRATARMVVGYARDPLVAYDLAEGGASAVYLRDVASIFATGGVVLGPVRLGMTVPVYLHTSEVSEPSFDIVAGDATFDVQVAPLPSQPGRPGFAVLGRLSVPLGGSQRSLGVESVSWEVAAVLDGRIGPVWLGGHLGWRGVPEVQFENYRWDDGLVGRFGLGVDVHSRWTVAAEALTFVGVLDRVLPASAPTEGILSVGYRPPSGLEARLGVGFPIVTGAGVPAFRLMASFGFRSAKPSGSRW